MNYEDINIEILVKDLTFFLETSPNFQSDKLDNMISKYERHHQLSEKSLEYMLKIYQKLDVEGYCFRLRG